MSRLRHPILGADLLAGPEMQLRHPSERIGSQSTSSYDEGAGCAFDNLSPDAYAERWVDVDAGATAVLTWFVANLGKLGFALTSPMPTSGVAWISLARDADERMGILVQGHADWWTEEDRQVQWADPEAADVDASECAHGFNRLRVHLAVTGVFADGRTGPRAG